MFGFSRRVWAQNRLLGSAICQVSSMGDLRLIGALGLEIPSARLLQKVGGYVVDPAPLRHPRPNVPFRPAAEGPQGAPNVEVEAMEAAAGADGGRGANDGPEAEKPDEPWGRDLRKCLRKFWDMACCDWLGLISLDLSIGFASFLRILRIRFLVTFQFARSRGLPSHPYSFVQRIARRPNKLSFLFIVGRKDHVVTQ